MPEATADGASAVLLRTAGVQRGAPLHRIGV